MKKKLNCILLIDDDEDDNFLHQRVIEKAKVAEKVVAVESGFEALDYLTQKQRGQYPNPDLIFLDINMPKMSGWEFLDAYDKLELEQKGKIIVVMLTTSVIPYDIKRAQKKSEVFDFKNKPLTQEMLDKLIHRYFADRV